MRWSDTGYHIFSKNSPFLAEAVCCWDEPIRGEDRGATVQVTREVEADLPRPLPLRRVISTHDTFRPCRRIHLLHQGGTTAGWGAHSDGFCSYVGYITLNFGFIVNELRACVCVCMFKKAWMGVQYIWTHVVYYILSYSNKRVSLGDFIIIMCSLLIY